MQQHSTTCTNSLERQVSKQARAIYNNSDNYFLSPHIEYEISCTDSTSDKTGAGASKCKLDYYADECYQHHRTQNSETFYLTFETIQFNMKAVQDSQDNLH